MIDYKFWNLITAGFSAIGTVGATIVALYFGYRRKCVKLKVSQMNGFPFGNSLPDIEGGYLAIRIVNQSEQPITISGVHFNIVERKFWRWRSPTSRYLLAGGSLIGSLPSTLHYGEVYNFVVPMNSLESVIHNSQNGVVDLDIIICIPVLNYDYRQKFDAKLLSEFLKDSS